MKPLLEQLKDRRIALGLKQHDMMHRVGVSRQQYQRLESKGNPRLDTLELIAKGLKSELLLVPQEALAKVRAVLNDNVPTSTHQRTQTGDEVHANDPWKDLLGDSE